MSKSELSKLREYFHILRLAKKPSMSEFWKYTKLIFIGFSILGAIAFIIKMIFGLFIVR